MQNNLPIDVLHESITTRVYRQRGGIDAICKQAKSAAAKQRLLNEREILEHLAGIDGVVKIAPGSWPQELLVLQDCGHPLAQLLRFGPVPVSELTRLANHLARTVMAVHRAGVIHRDINPSNILLAASGEPVLIDFGLAVLADGDSAVAEKSEILGTLAYLAPEQSGRTGRQIDHRADLYALGATLYEMATGRPPFQAPDALQLIHDHLVRDPQPPDQRNPKVPAALSLMILRLLAKAPEQRYQSAEGLLHDLTRLQAETENGDTAVFELGERDFPAWLAAPEQLIGRDTEIEQLRAALVAARQSSNRTVLIEGAAGVGKSALIEQLRLLVASAGGRVVRGKVDQYQKDGATSGEIAEALRELARSLLAQPPQELELMRSRILEHLGRNAGLICGVVPEFALMLGPQPEPPKVDPSQAGLQLLQATVELLEAVLSTGAPLVLVLEDLQWSGSRVLRAFERLMNESGLRGLLLVGTYRPDATSADSVLPVKLAEWQTQRAPPLRIQVGNLSLAEVGELLARMLRLDIARAVDLARAVRGLTGGNPFDTVVTINALRQEGLLELRENGWHWEEAAIMHFVGRGTVVDLLAARLALLPQSARELLDLMSCLGNAVEFALLEAAAELESSQLRHILRAAFEDGLLITEQRGDREVAHFRHDRVQQAILDGMSDLRRGSLHLAMARRLADHPQFCSDAAQQYLAAIAHLEDRAERRLAAALFHEFARRLASSANYSLAERYLRAASELLDADPDGVEPTVRGDIAIAWHAALYSLGRTEETDALYSRIREIVADPVGIANAACLQMQSLYERGESGVALELGLNLLARLGLQRPPGQVRLDEPGRLEALREWIAHERGIDFSGRPLMQERRILAVSRLIAPTQRAAFLNLDTEALVWLSLRAQQLWSDHGPCAELLPAIARLGSLLTPLGDFRTGFDMSRHAVIVGEAQGWEPQTSEARNVFANSTCAWLEPVEVALDHCARAMRVLISADASGAGNTAIYAARFQLDIAPSVHSAQTEVEEASMLCKRIGHRNGTAHSACMRQFLRALRGETKPGTFDDSAFDEQAFLQEFTRLHFIEPTYFNYRALAALLFADGPQMRRHADRAMAGLRELPGLYLLLHVHLTYALSRAWQLQREPAVAQSALLGEQLESSRAWLAMRAQDQPGNFLHLSMLVDAEQSWAHGDWWKAAATYDAAVLQAEKCRRPWHRALIFERAGNFYGTRGLAGTARHLLTRARDEYLAWGATEKVARMQNEHEFLRMAQNRANSLLAGPATSSGSDGISRGALDLMGVLQASQALSSETNLERLTARVMEVLCALSGGTRVLVLSCHEAGQWLLMSSRTGEPPVAVKEAVDSGRLPGSVFNYVERTGETLLLDDALADDRFRHDPYFARLPLCSVLLAPIVGQGDTRVMLYLENDRGRAAFNAQSQDAVHLIAGQLGVSYSNAQLYESLERRVLARTVELQQLQEQLVATARRAGKSEVANNVLHNVGNVLNSINVSAGAVRQTLGKSRLEGLSRAIALMDEHSSDLGSFFETDPRGKGLLAYLKEIAKVLQAERQDSMADLDRLVRSVDHVNHVVQAQQSHAGPSTLLENIHPAELLEEALRLSQETIDRHRVSIVRAYAQVPPVLLDRPRVLQILVNLIDNAARAMQSTPGGQRVLTLGTAVVHDGRADQLRISVKDAGEGIPPENLQRIFSHGFTTRTDGHGFGLHSSALAAMEMGAKLTAWSDGIERGSIFYLDVNLDAGASSMARIT